MGTINKEARANILGIANKCIAQQVHDYAVANQAHLWKPPSVLDVVNVLTALASYTEQHGEVIDHESGARKTQWEEGCCGLSFVIYPL